MRSLRATRPARNAPPPDRKRRERSGAQNAGLLHERQRERPENRGDREHERVLGRLGESDPDEQPRRYRPSAPGTAGKYRDRLGQSDDEGRLPPEAPRTARILVMRR